MVPEGRLLSPIRVARLASAFELSEAEVVTDASVIVGWRDAQTRLHDWLNARRVAWTDEAHYFVYRVRLQVWMAGNDLFRGCAQPHS
jgi:hypothetical protein